MITGYKLLSDAVYLLALLILLCKLWMYTSSAGVSAKTQLLYTLVLTMRYFDLFTDSFVVYNSMYKAAYLCLSYAILASMYAKFHKTYDKEFDTFRFEFLILLALILACVHKYDREPIQISWAFSEYLECVAVWPQFYMIAKTTKVRIGVFLYLLALGLYKIFSIQDQMYQGSTEERYDAFSDLSRGAQLVPYFTFWILCVIGVVEITGEKTSWLAQNLAETDQNAIFTIKLPSSDSKDRSSHLRLLENAVDVVQDGVFESNNVAKTLDIKDLEKATFYSTSKVRINNTCQEKISPAVA